MASCLASGAGYPGSFAASTSTFSMTGGLARRSPAFAMSAAATRPDRCAWRPGSSGNASKMPKMRGPRRSANHAIVAGSSCHREAALQEGLDLAFLAGLRLELHVQCDLDHDALLPPATASAVG